MENYIGFIEFFVVILFAVAWAVLELVGRRLDKKKLAERVKKPPQKRAKKRTKK